MEETKYLYIGIDIRKERAMISFFHQGLTAPETISTVADEERYAIPPAIYRTAEGTLFYGAEAQKRSGEADGAYFPDLYTRAVEGEEEAKGYLLLFLRRLLQFADHYADLGLTPLLAITVPSLDPPVISCFTSLRDELGFGEEEFFLMDYAESFFAYAYHQDPAITMHDVILFDFEGEEITAILLHADGVGGMRRVSPGRKSWAFSPVRCPRGELKDQFMARVVQDAFAKHIISGIYLVGEGFDGNWMKETLQAMGPNKRIFLGRNLSTQGAALVAYRNVVTKGWNYYFNGPYKLKGEVSLKVRRRGSGQQLRLTTLGANYFLSTPTYRFLYDGDPQLEIWIRTRERNRARVDLFTLDCLPERPKRSIRLCLRAVPKSDTTAILEVWDDGFGELYESSGKRWEFLLNLQ